MDAKILAFTGVAALLTITPGADMALVTRVALRYGRRTALLTNFGIVVGLFFWGVASALGVAAIFNTSATAFTALKLVGAAYLIFLGGQAIWQTLSRKSGVEGESYRTLEGNPALPGKAAFRQGLLNNLLNPKIGVFYTTFLPQFISSGDSVFVKSVLLTFIHIGLTLVWLWAYAAFVVKSGDWLRRPAVRNTLERITGVVLIGLGVRLALEKQP